jgi:hypothetical protein
MVSDFETRKTLIAICELLRTQVAYFSNLQTSASALLYTLTKADRLRSGMTQNVNGLKIYSEATRCFGKLMRCSNN